MAASGGSVTDPAALSLAGEVGTQPCLRCGARLSVAAFAVGAKVRCADCRAVNVVGQPPPARATLHGRASEADLAAAGRSGVFDDDPLARIFHGASSGMLPVIEEVRDGAAAGSATIDLRALNKFQPALDALAPGRVGGSAAAGTLPSPEDTTTGTAVGQAAGAVGSSLGDRADAGNHLGAGGASEAVAASRRLGQWSDQLESCQLGAYRILRRVATGGMGTVYEAEHIALHRRVAVKILHRDIAGSQEIQERIQREALTLARIRHEHIVEIFDIGNFEGRPFLVMEFVGGGDLKNLLAARPMEERETLRVAAEIAEAVDYAHQRGIIHRDLKPANILLDEAQSVMVADFGLAKVIGASTQLTATGTTVGTPAYMAPEQARGQVDRLDARADVYSIGAILYEMLTRRAPFDGAHLMDVLYKVVHERPAPPQRLNPKISIDAATICMKAMAQQPEDRYESAWALMTDISALLHGEPIQARPPSPAMLLWRHVKRYAAVWAMALVLALGIGFEAGRFVVGTYRTATARAELADIRAEAAASSPVGGVGSGTAADAQATVSAVDARIARYRTAIARLDLLFKQTGLPEAESCRQELQADLQQWLTVRRLEDKLAEAQKLMEAGKYREADICLGLVVQTDPGPAASEAFGEIQALKTTGRLRGEQLVELREERDLHADQATYLAAQKKLTQKDFAAAEEALRGLLIQIPPDAKLYASPQVRAQMATLRAAAQSALQTATKHREEQLALKLQKELAARLDPFKAIPGISDVVSHWLSDSGDASATDTAATLPPVDPSLATPPGVTPPAPPPALATPPPTAPSPTAGPSLPSVDELWKALVPHVAPGGKPPPPHQGAVQQAPAPEPAKGR
ncbi:MAG: protein kinase domain-containing protein [Planctomycetota bacterium]